MVAYYLRLSLSYSVLSLNHPNVNGELKVNVTCYAFQQLMLRLSWHENVLEFDSNLHFKHRGNPLRILVAVLFLVHASELSCCFVLLYHSNRHCY